MSIIANRPIIGGVQHRECSMCHRVLPEQKPYFSTNGMNAKGERPFKAKCNDCQNEYQQQFYKHKDAAQARPDQGERSTSQVLDLVPANVHLLIDVDNQRGNLTNMHRASKEGDSKRPANWLQTEQAKEFIAALAASLNVGIDYILQAVSGRDGGTWAHWQVCVEYARYLSPAFAIRWNEYARLYLEGKSRHAEPAEHTSDAVDQIKNGFVALFGPAIERLILSAVGNVLEQRFGDMPQQAAETHDAAIETRDTLRGATVIEREVRTEVHHEWVMNGHCYLAVDVANNRLAIGETNKEPARRLEDSDYNGGKSGGTWVLAYSFATDDRKAAEQDLIRLARNAGAIPITGTRGTFVYERRIEQDFKQLPARIKYENLRRWVAQARLFEAPMFIYDQ